MCIYPLFLHAFVHTCMLDLPSGNHKNILNDANVPWSEYRYFDPKTVGLDFEGMMTDIEVECYLDTITSSEFET